MTDQVTDLLGRITSFEQLEGLTALQRIFALAEFADEAAATLNRSLESHAEALDATGREQVGQLLEQLSVKVETAAKTLQRMSERG